MASDLLIIGQGLAGTMVAWEAHWQGLQVTIIDPDPADSASKVAAGIVNPITSKRLSKSWDFDRLFPVAELFYQRTAKELGVAHYRRLPILRCLDEEVSTNAWEKKREREDFRQLWTDDARANQPVDENFFRRPGIHFATASSGVLATEEFLQASRRFFSKHHQVVAEEVDIDSLTPGDTGVEYWGLSAKQAVLCQGWQGTSNRFFDWVPLRRARGEVAEFELPGCDEDRVVNRGKWLLPKGGGRFLAGSTYDWATTHSDPTDAGLEEIRCGLGKILAKPCPDILRHRAGVRPVIQGSRLLCGRHPGHPSIAFLNGLGSKGVLNAPLHAAALVSHLVHGTAIDDAVDLQGNT